MGDNFIKMSRRSDILTGGPEIDRLRGQRRAPPDTLL